MGPIPRGACRTAAGAGALAVVLAACGREARGGADAALEGVPGGREVAAVRAHYQARDMAAAGAWTWMAPDSTVFVLIDAQSTVEDLVQGRADLWLAHDTSALQVGRSDVMPSAAEFGAYAFEDLTGDGIPDLFGYVADSAGVSYPVFIPGARGGMTEELAGVAPDWRFSTDDDHLPSVLAGAAGPCALRLWVEAPVPDGGGEGWRYLPLVRGGGLLAPRQAAPSCDAGGAGVLPGGPVP